MLPCLIGAKYTMTADIYSLLVTQDTTSGRIVKSWTKTKNVSCYAQSIKTDAVSDASSGKKFNRDYDEYEFIKVYTFERLSKRDRISNIKTVGGYPVWTEIDTIDNAPSMFEVQGNIPTIDPFGHLIEYEILAKRVSIQDGE